MAAKVCPRVTERSTSNFHPQPLLVLPGLGIIYEALQKLRPSWLAADLLLNAGSALANGGQVMFCPQPLHHLPSQPCLAAPMLLHGRTADSALSRNCTLLGWLRDCC